METQSLGDTFLWLAVKNVVKFSVTTLHLLSGDSRIGIVQKVFSEKASAIARMRQKCVRNASKMRQKCFKMGLVLLGIEEGPKCIRNPSKLRQKCVKNARNTFGGEHLLDDTDRNLTENFATENP